MSFWEALPAGADLVEKRYRIIQKSLADRLDADFLRENAPGAALFAGESGSGRLTECYYLAKELSGGISGALMFYPSRNMRSYLDFSYQAFMRSSTAFSGESLLRVFDICLSSPHLIGDGDLSDLRYSFLRFKAALFNASGDSSASAARELAEDMRSNLLKRMSSGGIAAEDVKSVIAFLSQSLSNSKNRCVIIEDLERANATVCNALLKTLEEPYAQSLIFLISSRPSRLLKTILSRTVRYNFPPVSEEKILDLLKRMGSACQPSLFRRVMAYADEKRLIELKGLASDLYGFIKKPEEGKREDMFARLCPIFDKGYCELADSADTAVVFLRILSDVAEVDFLSSTSHSSFYKDLIRRINRAVEDISLFNISPSDAIGMLMA